MLVSCTWVVGQQSIYLALVARTLSADKSCNAHVALVTALEILPVEVVVSLFPGRIVVTKGSLPDLVM